MYINLYKASGRDSQKILIATDKGNKRDLPTLLDTQKYLVRRVFSSNLSDSEAEIAHRHLNKVVIISLHDTKVVDFEDFDPLVLATPMPEFEKQGRIRWMNNLWRDQ